MNALPIEDLTPAQIVAELDEYIIGQKAAKRAVAVALRNRYRRLSLPESIRNDVLPKNILMIGPTGVGKTEIARRLAQLARAPFIKVEATKFTEVGYVGRDVDSIIRDLAANAVRLVEKERAELIEPAARASALQKLAGMVLDRMEPDTGYELGSDPLDTESWIEQQRKFEEKAREREARTLQIQAEIEAGQHQEVLVEIETEEQGTQFLQVFTPQGMEEMGLDMMGPNSPFGGTRRAFRQARVADALPILIESESKQMMDSGTLNREAIERTEQTGIVFIDEIDKVAIQSKGGSGPDVSREGVQRDLLPVIEGSTVATKFGPVRTDHILFIAAGAFHMAKPSDLIPELQGRLPIRVELESLGEEDFVRILREPRNALTKQYQQLLAVDGVQLALTDDAILELAHFAREANQRIENIGARRLHTVMERMLEDVLFEAPYAEERTLVIDRQAVRDKLTPLLANVESLKRVL